MSNVNLKSVIATTRFYNLLLSKIEKEIQGFDLNMSEFGILDMLLHKWERPVQKIAERIFITSVISSMLFPLKNTFNLTKR